MRSNSTIEWNEAQINQLAELWAAGLPISAIAVALGVSKNAISGKVHRLNLLGRASPIKRDGKPKPARSARRLPKLRELSPISSDAVTSTRKSPRTPAVQDGGDVGTNEPVIKQTVSLVPDLQSPPALMAAPPRKRGSCIWPMWNGREKPTHVYCGAPCTGNYCDAHRATAYVPHKRADYLDRTA